MGSVSGDLCGPEWLQDRAAHRTNAQCPGNPGTRPSASWCDLKPQHLPAPEFLFQKPIALIFKILTTAYLRESSNVPSPGEREQLPSTAWHRHPDAPSSTGNSQDGPFGLGKKGDRPGLSRGACRSRAGALRIWEQEGGCGGWCWGKGVRGLGVCVWGILLVHNRCSINICH